MEMNITSQHLYVGLLMVALGATFLRGDKLFRFIGWVTLWQLFSPARPVYEDLPLMFVSFAALEFFYARLRIVATLYPRR